MVARVMEEPSTRERQESQKNLEGIKVEAPPEIFPQIFGEVVGEVFRDEVKQGHGKGNLDR